MSNPTKHQKRKPKVSSATSRDGLQAAAKQIQASKKQSKAQARISKSQATGVTAQINGEFAQVQSLFGTAEQRPSQTQILTKFPESTVQDLADVMSGL